MALQLEVIIGTYEEFLVGYKIQSSKDGKVSLIQSFASRSHTASVRCLTSSGCYLASGGADDRIFIYDLNTRKEHQVLMQHNGTVNAISFTPDGTYLLSGGDDGQMFAIRTKTWQIDGEWKKAHSGSAITQISCHPSGKLALTLGSDLTLRTWNLIKGRCVYTTNLKNKKSLGNTPDCVLWSMNGDYFTLIGPRVIEIWSIESAGMIKEQTCNSKPICCYWLTNDYVFVGLEDGKLMLTSTDKNEEAKYFEAHQQRVKCIYFLDGILATASSSGDVCIWTVDMENKKINKIASTNIGCRPTCIRVLDLTQFDDHCKNLTEDISNTSDAENENKSKQEKQQGIGVVTIEYDDGNEENTSDVIKSNSSDIKNSSSKNNPKKLNKNKRIKPDTKAIPIKQKKIVTDVKSDTAINCDDSDSSEEEKPNFVRLKKSMKKKIKKKITKIK